jgi:hypothetical protein
MSYFISRHFYEQVGTPSNACQCAGAHHRYPIRSEAAYVPPARPTSRPMIAGIVTLEKGGKALPPALAMLGGDILAPLSGAADRNVAHNKTLGATYLSIADTEDRCTSLVIVAPIFACSSIPPQFFCPLSHCSKFMPSLMIRDVQGTTLAAGRQLIWQESIGNEKS